MSLGNRCEMCQAEPGQPCTNLIQPGVPLPMGRAEHFARTLPPDDTRQRRRNRQRGTQP